MTNRWLLFAVVLCFGSTVRAQAPAAGNYSPEKYTVQESRNNLAKMRDGVRLSVDIYRPAAAGKSPAILIGTPYSNNTAGMANRARWFARRGYAVAIADVRGRYDSEGEWDPFGSKHRTDGYDLVEWVAHEPWCDGKVGMMGLSYSGWFQWWTATEAPPSLKAIVPEVAPPDAFANAPYQDGVLVSWLLDWGAAHSGRTTQIAGEGAYGGFSRTRNRDFMVTPYLGMNARRGAMNSPWFDGWLRDNLATADYWKAIAYQTPERYGKVTAPSLAATGWFDANFPGSPMNYLGVKKYGATEAARHPRMVIGPWQHVFNKATKLVGTDFGPQAIIDWDGCVCRWFDHQLKGEANGAADDPPVQVFVMGPNRWRAEKDWPLPQTRWTKYFLHGGGNLSTTSPNEEPADHYVYDPAKPTRDSFLEKGNGHIDGPVDTRASAGDDVLVYTTPPLAEDVEVIGPVEAKLFAATSARDTDWMVRLTDVRLDGFSALLCDGVIRARCRDPQTAGVFTAKALSTIEPGKPYEYTIRFWRATGLVFGKGHRIRVEVSSSYFPYYLRNLNTGADNIALETKAVIARQTVFHDGQHPSHVVLPVIPAVGAAPSGSK